LAHVFRAKNIKGSHSFIAICRAGTLTAIVQDVAPCPARFCRRHHHHHHHHDCASVDILIILNENDDDDDGNTTMLIRSGRGSFPFPLHAPLTRPFCGRIRQSSCFAAVAHIFFLTCQYWFHQWMAFNILRLWALVGLWRGILVRQCRRHCCLGK
jgi:hypothetical protein